MDQFAGLFFGPQTAVQNHQTAAYGGKRQYKQAEANILQQIYFPRHTCTILQVPAVEGLVCATSRAFTTATWLAFVC